MEKKQQLRPRRRDLKHTDPALIQRRGVLGEREAEDFLIRERKMRLLHRNWRSGREELDLIMLDHEVLVIVEVRTRQENALVSGYSSLTAAKRMALRRAGSKFLAAHIGQYSYFRLDVVEVNLCDEVITDILHFENIPIFSKYQGH